MGHRTKNVKKKNKEIISKIKEKLNFFFDFFIFFKEIFSIFAIHIQILCKTLKA
jgi:hypothetical protein